MHTHGEYALVTEREIARLDVIVIKDLRARGVPMGRWPWVLWMRTERVRRLEDKMLEEAGWPMPTR